ncbi:MAG: 4-(cytidine 5'-diphospho)-2-C-methyl-D-erythritol kinase [Planctomycetota bacterium]|jgi:4-diphosphocytidyl-2-C-methyl-D-erythritol kinase
MSTNITKATGITMVDKEQFTTFGDGLLVRAPAKINLTLLIAGKRPDGFHEIETIMAKVNFYDEILIQQNGKSGIELVCKGPYSAPPGRQNLVYQACKMLLDSCGSPANIKITLTKNIPAGAGLGSASSDAAATLLAINRLLQLDAQPQQLWEMAGKLGSDVPFFLDGPLAFCTGKGEKIKKSDKKLDFLSLLILPDVTVSTKKVYANYKHNPDLYETLSKQINSYIEKNSIDLALKMCTNMLEISCFSVYKELTELKAKVESLGIRPVCLSGSGSAMFYLLGSKDIQKAKHQQRKLEQNISCKSIIVSNNEW